MRSRLDALRFTLAGMIKERVFRHYGIPWSRSGLEPGLTPFLERGRPIALVDVGASSGQFTAAVEAHCGIRRALLVEPQPQRCSELRTRFADARFTIAECAASDAVGMAELAILSFDFASSLLPVLPEVDRMGSRLDLGVRARIRVAARPLDDLLADAAIDGPIDLLKIDVQGAELAVLRGAIRTLARVRLIWTEVSFRALYEGSALFGDVHAFLGRHAFRLHSLHEGFRGHDGELLQADALFVGPGPAVTR